MCKKGNDSKSKNLTYHAMLERLSDDKFYT